MRKPNRKGDNVVALRASTPPADPSSIFFSELGTLIRHYIPVVGVDTVIKTLDTYQYNIEASIDGAFIRRDQEAQKATDKLSVMLKSPDTYTQAIL